MSGIGRRVEVLGGLLKRITGLTRTGEAVPSEALRLAERVLTAAAPDAGRFVGLPRSFEALLADLRSGERFRIHGALGDLRGIVTALEKRPVATGSLLHLRGRWQAGIGEALLGPLRQQRQRISHSPTAQPGRFYEVEVRFDPATGEPLEFLASDHPTLSPRRREAVVRALFHPALQEVYLDGRQPRHIGMEVQPRGRSVVRFDPAPSRAPFIIRRGDDAPASLPGRVLEVLEQVSGRPLRLPRPRIRRTVVEGVPILDAPNALYDDNARFAAETLARIQEVRMTTNIRGPQPLARVQVSVAPTGQFVGLEASMPVGREEVTLYRYGTPSLGRAFTLDYALMYPPEGDRARRVPLFFYWDGVEPPGRLQHRAMVRWLGRPEFLAARKTGRAIKASLQSRWKGEPPYDRKEGMFRVRGQDQTIAVLGDITGADIFIRARDGHRVVFWDRDAQFLRATRRMIAQKWDRALEAGLSLPPELRIEGHLGDWFGTELDADYVESFHPFSMRDRMELIPAAEEALLRAFLYDALLSKLALDGKGVFVVSSQDDLIKLLAGIVGEDPLLVLHRSGYNQRQAPIYGGYAAAPVPPHTYSWLEFGRLPIPLPHGLRVRTTGR